EQRLEIRARSDIDSRDRRVRGDERHDRHVAAEPSEAADQRDVTARREARERVREGVLTTDFENFVRAETSGQRANFLLPVGMLLVVDGADSAEGGRALELPVLRARDY